ncbi:MAG: hypothetical protein ACK5P7_01420 [Bdellovibrio sp.]
MKFVLVTVFILMFLTSSFLAGADESVRLQKDPNYKGPKVQPPVLKYIKASMPPRAPRSPPPQCLAGSPRNLSLEKQFQNSSRLFGVGKKVGEKPSEFAEFFFEAKSSRHVASALPNRQLKKACVVAALKRQSGGPGYLCRSPASQPIKIGSANEAGPCVSSDMAEYLTWAVNSAVECLSTKEKPLDPLLVLKKLNNETGFAFFQAGTGGVGMGQLTTSAIEEINRTSKQTLAPFRNQKKKACLPFQQALSKRAPASSNQRCHFLHYSEGLSNSLSYSLAYLVHSRDNLLPEFTKEARKCGIKKQQVFDLAALASYGPEGSRVQSTLLKILKKTCKKPDLFVAEAQRQIAYLKQTQVKMRELLRLAGPAIKKPEDCLE